MRRGMFGSNLRKHNRISIVEETADQPFFAAWPPHSSPAADDEQGGPTEHLVNHVVIPLTHGEKDGDAHSGAGRQRSMFSDETGPLVARRIEGHGRRLKSRHQENNSCIETFGQPLRSRERASGPSPSSPVREL